MKYSESYSGKKNKFGTGFYIVIACCLLGLGGASWFALSNYTAETPPAESKEESGEYNNDTPSYNENVSQTPPQSTPAEDVAEQVSDQPYSSEETVSEQTVRVFTMPVQGEVLKEHSDSQLQYSATYGDMRLHCGIDLACEKGTSVSACSDGTVQSIELNTSYGNVITIDHGDGITIKYSAIDNIEVKQGEKVKAGDIIGTSATVPAECSDKSHIHLEVIKNGKSVAPLEALGLN